MHINLRHRHRQLLHLLPIQPLQSVFHARDQLLTTCQVGIVPLWLLRRLIRLPYVLRTRQGAVAEADAAWIQFQTHRVGFPPLQVHIRNGTGDRRQAAVAGCRKPAEAVAQQIAGEHDRQHGQDDH
ncbi:MAG: hypothetical protein ACOCXJ_01460 [Planctomycetota bacterium]